MRMPGPSDYTNKEEYLFKLANKYGFDLCLAYSYKKADGSLGFSKWYPYLKLMEKGYQEYIPELGMTRQRFLELASHRTIGDIELLIDIDDPGNYPSIKENAREICKALNDNHIDYKVYWTGSKSYHIHLLLPALKELNKEDRRKFKQKFLSQFLKGSDAQKATERSMISIEGVPHYRSGLPKREVTEFEQRRGYSESG